MMGICFRAGVLVKFPFWFTNQAIENFCKIFDMKKLLILLLLPATWLQAQKTVVSYAATIAEHRAEYKKDFISNPRSPLQEADLVNLRFFDANKNYRVKCTFERTPDEKPFDLPTYSGVTKPYRKYGVLSFELDGKACHLAVYQSMRLINMPQYRDHLFLPFRDLTNDETTYGGGRYIDMTVAETQGQEVYLDFNKCYNPWCGYSDGYSCPIPPSENQLEVAVLAGEKAYAGPKKHK